jgi:hypothetical protein
MKAECSSCTGKIISHRTSRAAGGGVNINFENQKVKALGTGPGGTLRRPGLWLKAELPAGVEAV